MFDLFFTQHHFANHVTLVAATLRKNAILNILLVAGFSDAETIRTFAEIA